MAGNSVSLCINPGRFTVTETTIANVPAPFSFVATYSPSGSGVSITPDERHCLGTGIQAGQSVACGITNTLQSTTVTNNSTSTGITPPTNNPAQSPITTRTFINPQGLQNSQSTTANPNLPTSPIPANPPFQVCATNEGVSGNTQSVQSVARFASNAETGNTQGASITTRIPSSMTIVISGKVDLNALRNFLENFGTKSFSIVLKSDLQPEDGVMTQVANPRLEGEVIAQNKDGAKQKNFNFVLSDVRTECKYITLAQAFGPAPNANVAPLGRLGTIGKVTASSITKELLGGLIVGTSPPAKVLPTVLNPPFASCQVEKAVSTTTAASGLFQQNTVAAGNLPDNLALYVMKGDASSISSISEIHLQFSLQ